TLRALIADTCRSLIGEGFKYIVVANSHFEPEHVKTLHGALDDVERTEGLTVGFLDLTRRERAKRLTEAFRRGESHADRYETSIVLASHPELVDAATMHDLPYRPIDMAKAIADGATEFHEIGLTEAYAGAPAEATAEEGDATLDALAAMLIEVARALVDGTGGRDRPGMFSRD
ncbi:MAG: creatininase family protein, partial [Gaiellales bacterium]